MTKLINGILTKDLGYKSQETTMFLVEYTGDRNNFRLDDEEINKIEFLSRIDVITRLTHKDTREFFIKHFKD